MWTLTPGRARALSTGGVSALGVVALVVAAVAPALPVRSLDLNDGSVWVTNTDRALLGRFNRQIDEIGSGLVGASASFDVLQDGRTVLLVDTALSTVQPVDVAFVQLAGELALPEGSTVALGGGTVAVTTQAGAVHTAPADAVTSMDLEQAPVHEAGRGAVTVVGHDGTVHVASPDPATWTRIGADGPTSTDLPAPGDGETVQLTAVGALPVALVGQTLVLPDVGQQDLGTAAVLQQPGPRADHVAVTTSEELLLVPLDGGEPTRVAGQGGDPVAAVRVAGCTHAAWDSPAHYVRVCDDGTSVSQQVPQATGSLRFRVNRDVVVLNDSRGGNVWALDDELVLVEDWEQVVPPEEDLGEEEDDRVEQVEQTLERTEENRPPVAEDDELGVRPDRTTFLPVLDNDSDPDGDVLVALPDAAPTVVSVPGGLQITPEAGADGTISVPYTADDGRGGTDTAVAAVRVVPYGTNNAPEQLRDSVTAVEQGRSVSHDVLADWRDPDGDDLVLLSAVATTDDTVRFRPDGAVTFIDAGLEPGRKTVAVTVSDGTATAEGELVVDVRPPGDLPPTARADQYTGVVGVPLVLDPLANDTDPNGDALRLSAVDPVAGAVVETDFATGRVSFLAEQARTYYLVYTVTDGPGSAQGLVRVDVTEAGENRPPIAVPDVALVSGGEAAVDVLLNDIDPDGDVLAVTSVGGADGTGLVASLVENRVVRIRALRELDGPRTLTYLVSDGQYEVSGSIAVLPVRAAVQDQPPVAVPDEAIVRVGDVVTVDVLRNDSDPEGGQLGITDAELVDGTGELFLGEGTLRFAAGDVAGRATLRYTVSDPGGQSAATEVSVSVLAADADTNRAPLPRPVTARTFTGSSTLIRIPLAGIDPDGDSVTLVGLGAAPALGRITGTGPDWLRYESFDATGTDRFEYVVVDTYGSRATGAVAVGVVARPAVNQPPVAADDLVTVRPDRLVAVPVLANDSDPDGDPLTLLDELDLPDGVEAEVDGELVRVRVGTEAGTTTLTYTVEDGRGGRSQAYLTVEAGAEAPLLAPIARDDAAAADEVVQGEDGTATVVVDVLANDSDPDGDVSDLDVTVRPTTAGGPTTTVQTDGSLRIGLTDRARVVLYTVTDGDGLAASAAVQVPAAAGNAPRLRPDLEPLEVTAGEELVVPLQDVVEDPDGDPVRLTTVAAVSATNSDGTSPVVDETTLRFVPAPDYSGPASITFEVTDGSGPDDPAGSTATLTLLLSVAAPDNLPPTFTPSQLSVAAGEETQVDLRAFVTDPDVDDLAGMEFALEQAPAGGVSASLAGSVLTVRAETSTAKGTQAQVGISVDDGSNDPVAGVVPVTVGGSSAPLAVANGDTVPDADAGRLVAVDVLANDVNPFPETPLQVSAARVSNGQGTVSVDEDQVAYTAPAGFVGRTTISYTVRDATQDPDREVTGTVEVTVRAEPAAPPAPTVLEVGDRFVTLQWPAPAANGAPITGYTVSAPGVSQGCESTTCRIEGLTNDVEYRFAVVATNEVGDSPSSPVSSPARPDVRPEKPAPPVLTFGDGQVDVAWTAPVSNGSPVTGYDLEISPGGGGASQVAVSGTSYTWSGLTNGQSYQVRVRAKSSAPEPSDWSEYSAAEVPAGVPATPAAPTAAVAGGEIGGQVTVTWSAPAGNGASIDGYRLVVLRDGSPAATLEVSGSTTQQTVEADNGSQYAFTVAARNKAGWSADSARSAAVQPFGKPFPVSVTAVTPRDRAADLTVGPVDGNGQTVQRLEYRTSTGTGTLQSLGGSSYRVGGLTNGVSYRFEVRACNSYCGDWGSPSAAVVPFGPPPAPRASATGNATTVTLRWAPPTTENGRSIDRLQTSVNGGAWQNQTVAAGEVTIGNGYNQTHSIRVRAVDSEGQISPEATASARSSAPPRTVAVSRSPNRYFGKTDGDVDCINCYYVRLDIRNFAPNTEYIASLGPYPYPNLRIRTDGNGNYSGDPGWFNGVSGERMTATVDGVSGSYTWP